MKVIEKEVVRRFMVAAYRRGHSTPYSMVDDYSVVQLADKLCRTTGHTTVGKENLISIFLTAAFHSIGSTVFLNLLPRMTLPVDSPTINKDLVVRVLSEHNREGIEDEPLAVTIIRDAIKLNSLGAEDGQFAKSDLQTKAAKKLLAFTKKLVRTEKGTFSFLKISE